LKNLKGLLIDATKFPAAIEAKLPAGAPKVSTMLVDAANKIPAIPDFPMELPDLPAVPALPEMPAALSRRSVTGVSVRETPNPVTPLEQSYTQPIEGVVGQVTTRRGM